MDMQERYNYPNPHFVEIGNGYMQYTYLHR